VSFDTRGQAPIGAPTRTNRVTLVWRGPPGWLLAEPIPPNPETPPWVRGAGRRTASGSPSGLSSLRRARTPRPVFMPGPRPLPSWASPLQGSLALRRGTTFGGCPPLSGFYSRRRGPHGPTAGPSGSAVASLHSPLARLEGPLEVLHLVIRPSGTATLPPLAAADGSRTPFQEPDPSASPRAPGHVAVPR
jgi:hypothetical protein